MKIPHYNVMLVEDEQLLLRSLERHIHQLTDEFRVICRAEDGRRALELLRDNDIHLVITDIHMPVMQGIELLETIARQYPQVKVVLLTGYAEFEYAQKAVRAGALDYLLKPVSDEALEQVFATAKKALVEHYQLEEDSGLSGASSREIVDTARRYLREHYAEAIDLSEFSSRMGFSSAYLTKLFQKHEGCSPSKYLTNLRINEAKHLLEHTGYTIREIGDRVGYPDQFYFSNVFRKQTGISPTDYRKSLGKES